MGRFGSQQEQHQDSDTSKSKLVLEICSISTTSVSCTHHHKHHHHHPHFIDWYRLLGVGEDAGFDVIRKKYHKLALQLHPDKNKHPKAEIAFKLVSEAYTCLSDTAKRRAFNLERRKLFCQECNKIPYTTTTCKSPPINSHPSRHNKSWSPANWSKSHKKILKSFRDIKERFKEEAKVIENCLSTTNAISRKEESPLFGPSDNNVVQSKIHQRERRESPVFNPSDYRCQGYPHLRSRSYRRPEQFLYLHRENMQGRGMYDSPIFKSKSTCVRS